MVVIIYKVLKVCIAILILCFINATIHNHTGTRWNGIPLRNLMCFTFWQVSTSANSCCTPLAFMRKTSNCLSWIRGYFRNIIFLFRCCWLLLLLFIVHFFISKRISIRASYFENNEYAHSLLRQSVHPSSFSSFFYLLKYHPYFWSIHQVSSVPPPKERVSQTYHFSPRPDIQSTVVQSLTQLWNFPMYNDTHCICTVHTPFLFPLGLGIAVCTYLESLSCTMDICKWVCIEGPSWKIQIYPVHVWTFRTIELTSFQSMIILNWFDIMIIMVLVLVVVVGRYVLIVFIYI